MDEISTESEAEKLYLKGAELERNNNYYDAIRYYKKALQLDPDIDIKLTKILRLQELSKYNSSATEDYDEDEDTESDSDAEDEYDGSEPLSERFQKLASKSNKMFTPKKATKALHLSNLPSEMITYILKWVVSDELDLRSLDQCALVCRGFYLCARDPQIWKSACIRAWNNDNIQLINYSSWRDMFLNHPKVGTNGCYIGETRYYRQGERSFQDQNYKPYHLVVYFRYLRFFADGNVLMINTPDVPNQVVGQLKSKYSKFGAVVRGSYTVVDDILHVTFKVKRMRKPNVKNNSKSQYITITYNMKFQIKKYQKWQTKLLWKEYKLSCPHEKSYETDYNIQDHLFPPLRFSRVKSYTVESERPLP